MHFNIILPSTPRFSGCLFPSRSANKMLSTLLVAPMCATCPAHLAVLGLVTLTASESSSVVYYSFQHPTITHQYHGISSKYLQVQSKYTLNCSNFRCHFTCGPNFWLTDALVQALLRGADCCSAVQDIPRYGMESAHLHCNTVTPDRIVRQANSIIVPSEQILIQT